MTRIVTATDDFNLDFEWSFGEKIAVVGENMWLPKLKTRIPVKVDYELVDNAELVIFTGGEDINPAIYGEQNRHSYINRTRDIIELDILKHAIHLNKRILGVCRGHQLINAFLGGYLAQDLLRDLAADHTHYHKIEKVNEGGTITDIFTDVNSLHHQGVTEVGAGLLGTSTYKGVYESCESESIMTVQFHPEFMMDDQSEEFFAFIKDWAKLGD